MVSGPVAVAGCAGFGERSASQSTAAPTAATTMAAKIGPSRRFPGKVTTEWLSITDDVLGGSGVISVSRVTSLRALCSSRRRFSAIRSAKTSRIILPIADEGVGPPSFAIACSSSSCSSCAVAWRPETSRERARITIASSTGG